MRASFRLHFVIWTALAALVLPFHAQSAPFAYIPNTYSNSISVIDTANNLVTATLFVGLGPSSVAVDPSGARVYVVEAHGVSIIDTATKSVAGFIPLEGGFLGGVAVNPEGTRLYVVDQNPGPGRVLVVDIATRSVIATVPVGRNPGHVAMSPVGARIYVTNIFSNNVSVIDTTTNSIEATITVGEEPVGVDVNRAGTRVYVANRNSSSVSVIDAATNTVIATTAVGSAPTGVAVDPVGPRVYVSNRDGGLPSTVSIIDTTTNVVSGTVKVGIAPLGVDVDQTGTRVYVANALSNSVSVIDTSANTVIATVAVGNLPTALGHFITPNTGGPTVVEYYHAGFDHYFITWMPGEIAKLDAGVEIRGWARTGYSFKTYTTAQVGTSPVCRYYIPPALGDSHFFGRGTAECNETGQKNPSFVLEDPSFMQMFLPVGGVCPAGMAQVYRVFSNRPDANHRYMTDRAVRDQMVVKGWLAEGDGPDLVVMCAPQ